MSALPAELQSLVAKGRAKYGQSGSRVKPKDGRNRYRLLLNPTKPWVDLGVHWIKPEKDAKPIAVVGCESVVHDKPCPICTAVDRAIGAAIDDESKKFYEEWKVKKSVIINALVRTKGEESDDPQILELTPTTFDQVLAIVQSHAEEGINLFDPNEGIDIVIEKSGRAMNTKYLVQPGAGTSKPVPTEAMKKLHDLEAHIEKEFFRGDETKALNAIAATAGVSVAGLLASSPKPKAIAAPSATNAAGSSVAEDDETETTAPATPSALTGATRTKPKPAPEPEPEVVEEEDETVEAEPEAPVKPAAAKPAVAPAEDDGMADILSQLDDL
ncbi:hypothetical protein [Aureimonas sp. AU40]|uniref:hypothetical protein n=1 Tax=Aureimonas sp. AU40 TaxID=1637747 RepID=UPI00078154A5|nr:hypothetical protein [Aureimonas sp. AU40]